MAKQNIYDNNAFFDNFKEIRDNEVNYNDLVETPILLSMLPDVNGKNVLDIGCGMGQHAKQYSDMGAKSVLGIDISEKMLAYAKEHNAASGIKYQRGTLEELILINGKFDLITSSLVFDYAENFDKLVKDTCSLMEDDGEFVFSMSHPMSTAYDGTIPRFTRSETGERIYANINNYFMEGLRKITWVVDDYELYHRTISSIINSLCNAGLIIEECQESRVSEEIRQKYFEMFSGAVHRPDFIFFRCKKR